MVTDESVEPSSPSTYRRLNSVLREQEAPIALQPYFPLAFAECRERPLDFNFDLFLLDDLALPTRISGRGSPEDESTTDPEDQQPVHFENAEEAIRYCREKLKSGWKVVRANDERKFVCHTHRWTSGNSFKRTVTVFPKPYEATRTILTRIYTWFVWTA